MCSKENKLATEKETSLFTHFNELNMSSTRKVV